MAFTCLSLHGIGLSHSRDLPFQAVWLPGGGHDSRGKRVSSPGQKPAAIRAITGETCRFCVFGAEAEAKCMLAPKMMFTSRFSTQYLLKGA